MEDIFRVSIIDFEIPWEPHLPFFEFICNKSCHLSIGMTPFKALFGRPYRSPLYWIEGRDDELLGSNLVQETVQKITIIKEKMRVLLKDEPVRGLIQFI